LSSNFSTGKKMDYQEYLSENIPDTIKTGEKTPEGEEIAKKLGLKYNGVQPGMKFGEKVFPSKHVFTDLSGKANHTTFMAANFEEAKNNLEKHTRAYEEGKKKSSFKNFYNDFKKN